jgi:hypothetical protein
MSMGTEAITEILLYELDSWNNFEAGIWRTRDGRELTIFEIDDSHLDNVIDFLLKATLTELSEAWLNKLIIERGRREAQKRAAFLRLKMSAEGKQL